MHAQPQPDHGATYAAKIRKEEARIDWSRPALELDRLVRAFNPWPIAETTLGGTQVRVWEARPWEPAPDAGATPIGSSLLPGAVVDVPGRIVVATGEGALELLTLQWPGRKPVSAREFLNSRPLAGARFGEVEP